MRIARWLFAALILSSPAQARNICYLSNMVPPAEFDHAPSADVIVKVFELPFDLLAEVCTSPINPIPIWTLNGCASQEGENFWIIRIRSDLSPAERECILRHEIAHVNGWVHSRRVYVEGAGVYAEGN